MKHDLADPRQCNEKHLKFVQNSCAQGYPQYIAENLIQKAKKQEICTGFLLKKT